MTSSADLTVWLALMAASNPDPAPSLLSVSVGPEAEIQVSTRDSCWEEHNGWIVLVRHMISDKCERIAIEKVS